MREKYAVVPARRLPAAAISTASSSGCARSSASATTGSEAGTRPSSPRPSPAACSAPITTSRTAATASRRFTAASIGTPSSARPLTEPGVGVKAGEYLLAVEGRDLRPPTNLFSLFENTADKLIEITVGPNPDGSGARTVKVVPVANEYRPAEPRLGRGERAEGPRGHQRPRRLRLRAEHGRAGPHLLQALLLPAGRQGRHHRRRALQRRRPDRRLLHRHPAPAGQRLLEHALRGGPEDARRPPSRGPRSCSSTRRPAPAATCCP